MLWQLHVEEPPRRAVIRAKACGLADWLARGRPQNHVPAQDDWEQARSLFEGVLHRALTLSRSLGHAGAPREAVLAGSTKDKLVSITEAQFTAMLFLDECAPLLRISHQINEGGHVVNIESSIGAVEWRQHAVVVCEEAGQSLQPMS